MQAKVMAIEEVTSKSGKSYWKVTLEDGHDYSYWDYGKVSFNEGDEIKCESTPWTNGKGFNLRNVEVLTDLSPREPLPKEFSIVNEVKKEMLSTNGTERKPLHALSLVELENEYQNAVRSGADGWYIGQISNIIKYEQIRLAIMELK